MNFKNGIQQKNIKIVWTVKIDLFFQNKVVFTMIENKMIENKMTDIETFKTILDQIHSSHTVQANKKTEIDFEKMWQITFDNWTKKKGADIYHTYTKFVDSLVDKFAYSTLEHIIVFWNDIRTTCRMISCFISCIQEVDVPKNPGWKVLMVFALEHFKVKFTAHKTQIYKDLITAIITDYSGGHLHRQTVCKAFVLLKELKLLSDFETFYLSACSSWFTEWVAKNLLLPSKLEILTNAENLTTHVETYNSQCDVYKNPQLLTDAIAIPTCAYLMPHVDSMIESDRYKELELMYNLVKRCDSLCGEFGKIISKNIITSCVSCDVVGLVCKNGKYMKILALFGANNKKMYSYFFHGFQTAIENLKLIEPFAIYIDSLFHSKKLTEDEFEKVIRETLDLSVYIRDKDVFERYYKINFGRRLLNGCQIEYERIGLTVLKEMFGMSFVHGMEIMFRDIESAKEVNKDFSSKILSVNVLTSGIWSMSTLLDVPNVLQPMIKDFETFYKKRFSNRNLRWLNYGSCEVKMNIGKKSFTLCTSTSQMCILLRLNDTDVVNVQNLELNDDRQLLSLSHSRHPILIKCDGGYKVNDKFTSKALRVKIMTVAAQKENSVEQKETQQKIEQQRFLEVDAAIVRIMKSRRTLDYNNIVVEVTKTLQPRFAVMPVMVKKRIESLLEREYLIRDETNTKVFNYLA